MLDGPFQFGNLSLFSQPDTLYIPGSALVNLQKECFVRTSFLIVAISAFLQLYPAPNAARAELRYLNPQDKNHDISDLSCDKFAELLKDDPNEVFVILVWSHGYISGTERLVSAFDENFFLGISVLLADACSQDPESSIGEALDKIVSSLARSR